MAASRRCGYWAGLLPQSCPRRRSLCVRTGRRGTSPGDRARSPSRSPQLSYSRRIHCGINVDVNLMSTGTIRPPRAPANAQTQEDSLSDMLDVAFRLVHGVVQEDVHVMLQDLAVLSQRSGLHHRVQELPRLTEAGRIMFKDHTLVKPRPT